MDISADATLSSLSQEGKINLSDVVDNIIMTAIKKEVRQVHDHKIWQRNDGRWCTYLRSKEGKRRLIVRADEKDLYMLLADNYEIDYKIPNTLIQGDSCTKKKERHTQKTPELTLAGLYDEWIQYRYKTVSREDTVRRNAYHWQQFYLHEPISLELINKPIKELTTIDLEIWIKSIIKKNSLDKRTYYNMSLPVRDMLRYAYKKGLISTNPMIGLEIRRDLFRATEKPLPETQVFNNTEVEALINYAFKRYHQQRGKGNIAMMIPVLFLTGLRLGEISAIRWTDIHPDHIHVCRIYGRCSELDEKDSDYWFDSYKIVDRLKKNAPPRDVQITEEDYHFFQWLKEKQKEQGESCEYIFSDQNGDHPAPGRVDSAIRRYCRALGILPRSSHKCRKTYVSRLLTSGMNVDRVRRQVGHKSEKTTLGSYCFDIRDSCENNAILRQARPNCDYMADL